MSTSQSEQILFGDINGTACLIEDTRANILALKTASSLSQGCWYGVTDAVTGTLGSGTVWLLALATDVLTLEGKFENSFSPEIAWEVLYNIDTDLFTQIEDNHSNLLEDSGGIQTISFDWGNGSYTGVRATGGSNVVAPVGQVQVLLNNVQIINGSLILIDAVSNGLIAECVLENDSVISLTNNVAFVTIRKTTLSNAGNMSVDNSPGTYIENDISTGGLLTFTDVTPTADVTGLTIKHSSTLAAVTVSDLVIANIDLSGSVISISTTTAPVFLIRNYMNSSSLVLSDLDGSIVVADNILDIQSVVSITTSTAAVTVQDNELNNSGIVATACNSQPIVANTNNLKSGSAFFVMNDGARTLTRNTLSTGLIITDTTAITTVDGNTINFGAVLETHTGVGTLSVSLNSILSAGFITVDSVIPTLLSIFANTITNSNQVFTAGFISTGDFFANEIRDASSIEHATDIIDFTMQQNRLGSGGIIRFQTNPTSDVILQGNDLTSFGRMYIDNADSCVIGHNCLTSDSFMDIIATGSGLIISSNALANDSSFTIRDGNQENNSFQMGFDFDSNGFASNNVYGLGSGAFVATAANTSTGEDYFNSSLV